MACVTGWEQLATFAAGVGAGAIGAIAGVASLVSFPVLILLGLPPVAANVTNTLGLIAAGFGGSWGYREELRAFPAATRRIAVTCTLGGLIGAVALVAAPPTVFEGIVPWLVLLACALVAAQPSLSAWLRRRSVARGIEPVDQLALGPRTTVAATLTGVYGGYFGAAAGVLMIGVLGIGTDLEARIINALKTWCLLMSNLTAALVFVLVADVAWAYVPALALGSVVGGLLGARVGRRLPAGAFRLIVVTGGVAMAIWLWVR